MTSDIDPFCAEFRREPFGHYARLRALGPIVWLEKHGIWAVSHHAQVCAVLSDWQNFSSAGGAGISNYFKEPGWRVPSIILEVDPPAHQRARAVMSRVLSASALRTLQPDFEAAACALIRQALDRGVVEAVSELVQPYVLTVFPNAVGMSVLDPEMMLLYGDMVFEGFGPRTAHHQQVMSRAGEASAWIDARCERDALKPGGLGAAIHSAADTGEISVAEAKLLVRSLLSAGIDTTIDSIALCLRCLAQHPAQWGLLRDDPRLSRAAFEESTRYDSSSQSLFRTTLRETEFEGTRLAKYDKVLVLLGSAGRDPARWDDPDRFDIRRRIAHQIGFGIGIHGCVAQMMARLEAETLLRALAEQCRTLEVVGAAELRVKPGLRGLVRLQLDLGGKSRPIATAPAVR